MPALTIKKYFCITGAFTKHFIIRACTQHGQRSHRHVKVNKKSIKRHTIMKVAGGLFAIGSLTGCIPYPVHKTLQLSSEVKVIDSNKTPIEGAKVILISSSYPYGFEKTREIKNTDMKGKAVFKSKKEWRVEAIMLHGAEFFFWNWCVHKQGFETILTSNLSSNEFENKPTFMLKRGKSTACPKKLR